MIQLSDLPALNASLNSLSLLLLLTGYVCIRRRYRTAHKRLMISAFCVSIAFLVSYVIYHSFGSEKRFEGQGWVRWFYFPMLISHIVLAATIPFLASWTLYLGLKGRFDRHRRWARITFPTWVYVSITGVLIYLVLYVWTPGTP